MLLWRDARRKQEKWVKIPELEELFDHLHKTKVNYESNDDRNVEEVFPGQKFIATFRKPSETKSGLEDYSHPITHSQPALHPPAVCCPSKSRQLSCS